MDQLVRRIGTLSGLMLLGLGIVILPGGFLPRGFLPPLAVMAAAQEDAGQQEDNGDKERREITPEMLDDLDENPDDPILELIDGIQKNMRRIEDLLNQKSTGAETTGLQRDTVKQIDKLIEEAIKAGAT